MVAWREVLWALKVPIVILGVGLMGGVVGLYFSAQAARLEAAIERARGLEQQRKELLKSLDAIRREIEEYRSRWSLDRWVPSFRDTLAAKAFAIVHLQGLLGRHGAEGVKIQEVPFGRERDRPPRGRAEKAEMERKVHLRVQATFKKWGELLKVLSALEEEPPLFTLEELQCKKEGRRIGVSFTISFPFRRADEV